MILPPSLAKQYMGPKASECSPQKVPLQHGKMVSNADARTSAKRHIGIAGKQFLIFRREALRIELLRIGKVIWAAMERVRGNKRVLVLMDQVAIDINIVMCHPRYRVSRWIEAQCFL